jgi:hypothetical protein
MTARLHPNVKPAQYHGDAFHGGGPTLSASVATVLVTQSPLHAYAVHPRLGGFRPSPTREMDFGTFVHALVLGTPVDVEIIAADNYRKKDAQHARDAAQEAGKIPMLERDAARARSLAAKIVERLGDEGIALEGMSETVVTWEETAPSGRVVTCRAMMDHLLLQHGRVLDLKTTGDANPDAWERGAVDHGYDVQTAAYTRAIEQLDPELAGRVEMLFFVIEQERPHAHWLGRPAGDMRELGERRWLRAVKAWDECLHAKSWPGYGHGGVRWISVPPWAAAREEALGG